MKNKSDNQLSENCKRQLEVLSHYHQVNHEKQVVTMKVHFSHVKDVLVDYLGDQKHPVFNEDFLAKVSDFSHTVPYPFKINVDLKIDNYANYPVETLMDSLQDTLEIFNFGAKKSRNINRIKMSLLIASGVVIFAWLFYFCSFKLFGDDDITHNTIHEIVYTIACVLLWEGIYILFLPDEQYHSISYEILKKVDCFSFINKQNKVLLSRNMEQLKVDWIHETRFQHRFRRLFLITATGYLCLAFCGLPELISITLNIQKSLLNIPILIISIILMVMLCISSFANISFYTGSGPLRRWALPLNIVSLAILLTSLTTHIINFAVYKQVNLFLFIANVILVIIAIISVIGLIIFKHHKKNR